MKTLRRVSLAAVAAWLLVAGLDARGELVILEGGKFLKATAFEVRGQKVRVELRGGGTLVLPLSRVERIVDDEIEIVEPTADPADEDVPAVRWQFADDQPVPATPYGELIHAAARRHRLNPALLAALVRHESAFDRYAVSRKGARGLMQLMPATARRFGVEEHEIFEPERNLEAGSSYLRWLLEHFDGDVARALAAYNAGEGTVERYGGVPPYRETHDYLRRIYATLGASQALAAVL